MVQVTSALRFGSINDHQDSFPELEGGINVDQGSRDDDVGVRRSNDFDIVEIQREEYMSGP